MTGIGIDRAEAERLWQRTGRAEDRLDMIERALAAVGRGRSHRAGGGDEDFNPGRK